MTCPQEPIPAGWKVWLGPVPPELVTFAIAIRDRVRSYPLGQIAQQKTWRGQTVAAYVSSHTWIYKNGMLVSGICIPGVSLLTPTGDASTGGGPLGGPNPDAATWTGADPDYTKVLIGAAIGAAAVFLWK